MSFPVDAVQETPRILSQWPVETVPEVALAEEARPMEWTKSSSKQFLIPRVWHKLAQPAPPLAWRPYTRKAGRLHRHCQLPPGLSYMCVYMYVCV